MQQDQTTDQKTIRFIPFMELGRLNAMAMLRKKNYLDRDTPILEAGCNVPIIMALPHIAETGWVVCLVPTDRSFLTHARLDVAVDDFYGLPVVAA